MINGSLNNIGKILNSTARCRCFIFHRLSTHSPGVSIHKNKKKCIYLKTIMCRCLQLFKKKHFDFEKNIVKILFIPV